LIVPPNLVPGFSGLVFIGSGRPYTGMKHEPGPDYSYTPIGTIRSPFTDIAGMPIQPVGARGVRGTIENP